MANDTKNIFISHIHEDDEGLAKLKDLIKSNGMTPRDLLEPRRLIAIGNDAARVVCNLCAACEVEHVRHPSYGGQALFVSKMCELYDLYADIIERHDTLFDGCPGPQAQVIDRRRHRYIMTPGQPYV